MKKFGLLEKLLFLFLILTCAASALLSPISASGVQSEEAQVTAQVFTEYGSFNQLVNQYAATLVRDLTNEVQHTDLGFSDLLMSEAEIQELLDNDWTQSDINAYKARQDQEIQERMSASMQLGNLHAIAIDNTTGTVLRRPKQSDLAENWEQSKAYYQFWLKAEYDEYGILTLRSSNTLGSFDFDPMGQLLYEADRSWEMPTGMTEPSIRNVTLIFGVPRVLESTDSISYLINQSRYYAYRQVAGSVNSFLVLAVLAASLLFSGKKMRQTRTGQFLDRIPLEAQIILSVLVLALLEEMNYNLGAILQDMFAQTSTDISGGFQLLSYEFSFLLEITGLFCTVYWIRSALACGWKATWRKMMTINLWKLLYRKIREGLSEVKQWMKECFTVDFSEKAHSRLIRLMLVNVLLFSFLCLLFQDFWAAVIYTIFLYIIIMRALKRLRNDYETLLGCTRRMALGDLETPVREQLGVFEPLRDELDDIRYGFHTAIEEETKSQKMKTELISNVSHDLKTPLTSLISYIDLMKNETDENRRKEYLEVLERNSMRLKHLIEDLFEVSKANSGDAKLEVMDVDLVALISQTLFELAPQIEKAGLTVKTSFGHDKIVLPLDSQKTYRIVENLISNAAKYSLPGSRVYLTVIERESEVVMSIRNISRTEIDFDPNDIVERFMRGDKSRNSEGSGLGLAIAKGFAEIQKARFTIETDGDFFKVIVAFDKTALNAWKPELQPLSQTVSPLIDMHGSDEQS